MRDIFKDAMVEQMDKVNRSTDGSNQLTDGYQHIMSCQECGREKALKSFKGLQNTKQ